MTQIGLPDLASLSSNAPEGQLGVFVGAKDDSIHRRASGMIGQIVDLREDALAQPCDALLECALSSSLRELTKRRLPS
jgi:hypothetical protein